MEFRPDVRTARWFGVGALAAVAIALAALVVLTQTRTGQSWVLGWTVGAVQGTMHGTLEVERVRGNLIRGATLHGIEIRDNAGQLFFRADSADVAYRLRSVLRGRMFFRHLVVYGPEMELVRMPGAEFWNFQEIFGDTNDQPATEPNATLLDLIEVYDADVRIRTPWEPAADDPEERQAAIRDALSPESRAVVQAVPGGFLQTVAIRHASGRFVDIQVAPDVLGGTFAAAEWFQGLIHVWREPIVVEDLRGEIGIYDETLDFQAPYVHLPQSDIRGYGSIRFAPDDVRVNVQLASDDVSLGDLQWLYPALPEDAEGRLTLLIETRPEGVLYLARGIDLSAPGTRLRGRLGLLVNDELRFVEPDLVADPLRVETIEALLPASLPVEDLRIRRATLEPADR